MKRNSRSYSHVGTHALNYKRHRDAKASEAAESVEQPNSPFLCWIRILFCPIIFPLLMIYELIFLEDKDESADNNPNEDCDEENESKISEMVGLASVASLSAAASVSSMLNTGPSSNNLGGGGNQHGNLGRALSRKGICLVPLCRRVLAWAICSTPQPPLLW